MLDLSSLHMATGKVQMTRIMTNLGLMTPHTAIFSAKAHVS